MSNKLREQYKKELKDLKEKMLKAESFAKKIPVFEDLIIENKYTEDRGSLDFGRQYKKIPLDWRIRRFSYKGDRAKYICNYKGECNEHLFNIYINTVSLFDEHNKFNLYDYIKDEDVFFIDRLNTTFYVRDCQIGDFLEKINNWYVEAIEKLKEFQKDKKIKELKKELDKLEAQNEQ
jgi:hypothetical protein